MSKSVISMWAVASFGVLLIFSLPGLSWAISFDLTDSGPFGSAGNKGASPSATVGGETLTLTTLTSVDDVRINLSGGGPGTVYIDPLGGGAQTATGGGSTGLSGRGKDADEVFDLKFFSVACFYCFHNIVAV